ncbi:hypothetical protein [Bradyrhizobium sp. Tv2a-2]|uniref:hypothetical protein n=1 Tax=Bradyrhizobium sp. Tv2a-2 TaxID=113395 RepID=UPI00040672A8|nr:hypothetical protein [Bradyrhizobium sp. Tv2a-2]
MTPEQVREIAEDVARIVAAEAAKEAVKETLTALGVKVDNLPEEQQVWAFARTMQQGTHRGVRVLITSTLGAVVTLVVGWIWYAFFKQIPPHP